MTNDPMFESLCLYLDLGFSIIPIQKHTKVAAIDWKEFQTRQPTKEEVKEWLTNGYVRWAVVTGEISNLMIVDCDNPDALRAADEMGLTNGCCVSTPNGYHYYFRPPKDGKIRKTVSGYNSNGTFWPQIKGLDLRNEGGYALLPPSEGYEWEIEEYDIEDELTVYQDWEGATFEEEKTNPLQEVPAATASNFADLDLTNIALEGQGKKVNDTWEKFKQLAESCLNGKIPRGGSGIHDATFKFLSEEVLFVGIGPELEARGWEFMTTFFSAPLTDGRFEKSLESVRQMERENHPERFDAYGNYIRHLDTKNIPIELNPNPTPNGPSNNYDADIELLDTHETGKFADDAHKQQFWQAPWLPKDSIVQVHGYSGHGKSMFLQHALHLAGLGLHFGPFERGKDKPKVLYLDFENGKQTMGRRVRLMRDSFGNPLENIQYWTPWMKDQYMNLREPDGINLLARMVKKAQPDIIVIDTIRSAFAGLKENSAEEWASINQLCLKLRNAGCTVVLVHHSNKPTMGGLGREAGSSNQLTVLETQLKVTQVYEDQDIAKSKGGIFAGDLEANPWLYMRAQTKKDTVLQMVFEVSYGKVREWTDLHEAKQYIGLAQKADGTTQVCYSLSPKDRLKKLIKGGKGLDEILGRMGRPVSTLQDWADELGFNLPKA